MAKNDLILLDGILDEYIIIVYNFLFLSVLKIG